MKRGWLIELDGAIHDTKENARYDNVRTYQINQVGISVVRFRNEEVMNDIDTVIKNVREVANKCGIKISSLKRKKNSN